MRHIYISVLSVVLLAWVLPSGAQYTVNANAVSTGGDCFRLTQATNYQVGSVWNNTQVNLSQNFEVHTKLYFGATDAGADGIAFVLQSTGTNAIGEQGGGIGYSKMPGASFIIEFDTYFNNEPWFNVGDPVADHIGFQANGDPYHNSWLGNALKAPEAFPFNIEDGLWHDAVFSWNASTHTMTVQIFGNTYSYTGDIVQNIFGNNPMVYWGFTAATGSYVGNEHGVCIVTPPPPPPPPTCGQLKTVTQGGWGAPPRGSNPGAYLRDHFASAFPNGVTIGNLNNQNYYVHLTSAQAIQNFLPQGGPPSTLNQNYVDPTARTSAGVLAGQILTLTLNVGFDKADPAFGPAGVQLGNMIIKSGTFAGWTVNDFLSLANQVLSGASKAYSPSVINDVADQINSNYDGGQSDGGFLRCPVMQTGSMQRNARSLAVMETNEGSSLQPNPARGRFALHMNGISGGTAEVLITNAMGSIVEKRMVPVTGKDQTLLFDLTRQAAGIYFIRWTSAAGTRTEKLLIQK
ncbi:MAG: lectin-like domain-containing protein [Flavisolibacter sp.]